MIPLSLLRGCLMKIACNNCGKDIEYTRKEIVTDLVHMKVVCPYCDNTTELKLYLCDYEENNECRKMGCQSFCFCTTDINHAKTPLVIFDSQEQYDEYEKRLNKL